MGLEQDWFYDWKLKNEDLPSPPACITAESWWVNFLAEGILEGGKKIESKEIKLIDWNLKNTWDGKAVQKVGHRMGADTYLITEGQLSGVLAVALEPSYHMEFLRNDFGWGEKPDTRGAEALILRPVINWQDAEDLFNSTPGDHYRNLNKVIAPRRYMTGRKLKRMIKQSEENWCCESMLWLLTLNGLNVDKNIFRKNVNLFHEWQDRRGYNLLKNKGDFNIY